MLYNFENFSFLIPSMFHPPMLIPKMLVFHDSKQDATEAATFINSHLLKSLQNQGIVKYYHSDMSIGYLQQTFEDFFQPDGTCQILHAIAGAVTVRKISNKLVKLSLSNTGRALKYKVCILSFNMDFARIWPS